MSLSQLGLQDFSRPSTASTEASLNSKMSLLSRKSSNSESQNESRPVSSAPATPVKQVLAPLPLHQVPTTPPQQQKEGKLVTPNSKTGSSQRPSVHVQSLNFDDAKKQESKQGHESSRSTSKSILKPRSTPTTPADKRTSSSIVGAKGSVRVMLERGSQRSSSSTSSSLQITNSRPTTSDKN